MLPTHYDYRLVALSISIAICAAYAALGLAERVADARGDFRSLWISGGAAAMGTAIWSMHYIGMLAFQLPVPVHYDIPLVLLSMAAAMIASAIALIFTSHAASNHKHLAVAALAMGMGIVSMHYIGMAAMRMRCTCTYDWRVVGLSVVIAIVVSGVALASLRYRGRLSGSHKLGAATLLGLAICSMHYTGMAAAHFWRSNGPVNLSDTASVSWLGGIGIAAGTLLLLALAIVSSIADKHFTAQSRKLQSSEERYRLLFERSLAGIYRAQLDGTIIDMNDACVRMLGYSTREQVLGRIIRNIHMPGESVEPYLEMLAETEHAASREMKISRADGSETWVLSSATVLDPQDGSPPEIQGMLLSIDDLKRTERDLRAAKHAAEGANLAKSQFLANMSHELRTPLAGVLGMTQVLMLGDLSQDQIECVDIVKNSADSLLTVIDEILEFSSDARTQASGTAEPFSFRELLEPEIKAVAAIAQSKGLDVHYAISSNVATQFWGNPRWIRQVLSGLINNAVKFTGMGEVEVSVRAEDTSDRQQLLNISVTDTGIGIPAEKHAVIFEPFNQVDNSSTRPFGGTGLGLAIVSNLVQAMNGHISLESEPGRGCRFSVLIPLATQPHAKGSGSGRDRAVAQTPAEPLLTGF
jgi:PAS domain S-box-containing protein